MLFMLTQFFEHFDITFPQKIASALLVGINIFRRNAEIFKFFRLPVEFLFGSGNPGVTVNHKRVHLRRKYVSVIFSLQRCTFTDII